MKMKTNKSLAYKCSLTLALALIVSVFAFMSVISVRAQADEESPAQPVDYVKLFNCDYNISTYGLDARNQKEGRGALTNSVKTSNGGLNIIEIGNIKNGNSDPVHIDATALDIQDKNDVALGMWMWVSDKTEFKGGDVRLTSTGYASNGEKDSIYWYFDEVVKQLENGEWRWVVLEFSDTVYYSKQTVDIIKGILSDIRYMRIHYQDWSADEVDVTTLKIDDVRLVRNTEDGKRAPTYDGSDKRIGYGTGDYMVKQLNEVDENAPAYYKFLNCEEDWTNYYYSFMKDESNFKEGNASVAFYGSGVMQFFAGSSYPPYGAFGNSTFLQAPMEDRKVMYDLTEAYLGFWFYYDSDREAKSLLWGRLELGSANSPDTDLFYFDLNYFKNQFSEKTEDNWYWIVLPLSEASQLGSPNLNKLNYFRIFINVETDQTNLKLDDIRLIRYESEASLAAPDYSVADPVGAGTGVYPTKEAERYIYNVIDADATPKGDGQKLFYRNDTKGAIFAVVFAVVAAGACVASIVLFNKFKRGKQK